ncbi:MAG: MFS transporter [Rhodobacteraceae bacterium PARR1]|nr:MAG: MFS transporter [Rhodobacteraceae bacterium PARR1]
MDRLFPAFGKTLSAARAPIAAFAAMGVLWGTFAAVLPDLKAQLGVDERELGLLLLATPLAAVAAMLAAPMIGAALGRVALPVAAGIMALAFVLPGQVWVPLLFPFAMMACGAGTGLTDVLMNARVSALENQRGLHLMNLCHAAYSFGYAGGAMATGAMRGAAWGPAWVMGTCALLALALALMTVERDGRIEGLRKPKDGSAATLGLIPIFGGVIVLIAFLTENAAENWSALHIEQTLGGSPEQGAMGPLAETPARAYAGVIARGVGSSVFAPTGLSLGGRLAEPASRARAVARATLLGYFGYFFGPPMLGFIAGTFGLRFAFVFAAAMLLTVLVVAPLMRRAGDRPAA